MATTFEWFIRMKSDSPYVEIYKIVQSIPKGRVLTYGLISNLLGKRMSAQGVGWALKALGRKPGTLNFDMSTVPWQRVVNSDGGTSTHKISEIPPDLQRQLLQEEGIVFDANEKIDLKIYLWWEGLKKYGLEP